MKILMNPVVQKQTITEDNTSFQMLMDIINTNKENPTDVVLCLQKYLDAPHEIPVGCGCHISSLCRHILISLSVV